MFRALLIIVAAVLIGLAAFAVNGPTVNSHHVNLVYLGAALFVLSFLDTAVLRRGGSST